MELLHALLTRTAAATPDAEVLAGMTYGELDARSNQLARLLISQGAGRDVPVALRVEKGPLALVGIFGILKSGSCYVPIDPKAPELRVAAILADARPLAVLTEWPDAAALSAEALPDRGQTGEDLAYILYTSGSTGTPKGVALSHRAGMAFVRHCLDDFGITAQDRVSSHAPLHFDLSILDVFVTVAAGATMVPITGAALAFPQVLAELIEQERITVWYSVPFALVQLLRGGGLERFAFAHLRTVLFAGEPMAAAHVRSLMEHWPAARFFNLYGPTETNVVTRHEITRAEAARLDEIPIGIEWPGVEVRILDGELCVRSDTTMSGYWGAPDETAAAFADGGFYRTGDVVRRDADGLLWFGGRRDDMVKIRGHRVELGEVEAVLRSHPDLAEVAALMVPHAELGAELVAAATPLAAPGAPEQRDILAFCAERLPAYMLPGRVELLAALPRTSTGKLDRSRLAETLPR
jgi:amino acid adenylation domain-containing protein